MVGVDEVGRGALAGPLLVVAARARADLPEGLRDSKLLTREQREALYPILVERFDFGEGWVSPTEIDRHGLGSCLKLGVRRALRSLSPLSTEEIVMDGIVNYIPRRFKLSRCEIDADDHLPVVSAASIYAKVTRDRFMIQLAARHRRFSFDHHVGYGTPQHHVEIETYGPIRFIHRLSFEPLRQIVLL